MNKNVLDVLAGVGMGIVGMTVGVWLWTLAFSKYGFITTLQAAYENHVLGGVISLGSLLNLGLFLILIKRNYRYAKGLVLWSVITALFVLILKFV